MYCVAVLIQPKNADIPKNQKEQARDMTIIKLLALFIFKGEFMELAGKIEKVVQSLPVKLTQEEIVECAKSLAKTTN